MPAPKYDVHPCVAMVRKWADELPVKTGRTLEQWAELVKRSGAAERKARITLLKDEFGLGTNTAWQIVAFAEDRQSWDGDPAVYLKQAPKYVEGMFAGNKAGLRPVYDRVHAEVRKLGRDAKVCPCKTIVPFYRRHVFAEAKPATRTRLELSFALGETPCKGVLVRNPRADENDRLKHQVHLSGVADVTPEVLKWLRAAYEADGG